MIFSCVYCELLGSSLSTSGRSLVQRSPTECGGSECNHESSVMRGTMSLVNLAS